VQQLPNSVALVQQVKRVVEVARAQQMCVFFYRHTTLPTALAGVAQLKGAMALQRAAQVADVKPNFLPNSPSHEIVPELQPLPSEVAFDKLMMSAFVAAIPNSTILLKMIKSDPISSNAKRFTLIIVHQDKFDSSSSY
jgi:biuret amidohydrolase